MKVTLTSSDTTLTYRFQVEFDSKTYQAIVYVQGRKFIDTDVTCNDEPVDDDIEEAIVDHIDKIWDTLVDNV